MYQDHRTSGSIVHMYIYKGMQEPYNQQYGWCDSSCAPFNTMQPMHPVAFMKLGHGSQLVVSVAYRWDGV